ncbi:hypothetical protein [Streptomyces sp. BH055]|uniref:hypothetical protein n=1 Tax=Streptomyces sp. BH055 TaxID=3401173 RepID=UPI003BB48C6E
MYQFPDGITDLGPVEPLEWETLQTLSLTCTLSQAQWRAAQAATHVTDVQIELLASPAGEAVPPLYAHTVKELATLASRHDDQVSAVAWRHASARLVLGISLLDRLLRGAPPLTVETIGDLAAGDPTLGLLQDLLGEPLERCSAIRTDLPPYEERAELRDRLAAIFTFATEDHDKARERRLGDRPQDTAWDGLLESAFSVGEQLPYDISYWLDHRDE